MNTTVLALQEEQVLAAVGKPGAQPSVQALYRAPAHGGGMENWEKAVGALWQQRMACRPAASRSSCRTRRLPPRPSPRRACR